MILNLIKTFCRVILPAAGFLIMLAGISEAATAIRTNQGKPGSSVVVTSRASGTATVDRLFPVVVDFSQVGPGGASVSFTTDPELTLQQPLPRSVAPGDSSITVQVRASANGLSFVNVFVKEEGGSRAISLPVQVGISGPRMEPSAGLKPGIGGRPANIIQLR